MKILKMKLENFQGVKELEIDPQGESSAIYGDNGTGKSTVYNAFTWLMYGKPSTTEKNYTPKTTGSHNLHHSVEMTVELADGSEMVLKKDYHEVYKTIKGNPQPVLSGHTTDYSMDGVPVSETQFKKNLLEIYHDEELAKMLTSYNYFLENMKVADRRKILLQVCGDADFNEVIESQGKVFVDDDIRYAFESNTKRAHPLMIEDGKAIFLAVREEKLEAYYNVINLIIAQVFDSLIKRPEGSLPVMVVIDEMARLCSRGAIYGLHNQILLTGRSRNITLIMVTQSYEALSGAYSKDEIQSIVANSAYVVVLDCKSPETAKSICSMVGNYKEREKTWSGTGKNRSVSISYRDKPILEPSDLSKLVVADEAIIVSAEFGYCRVKKSFYFNDAALGELSRKVQTYNQEALGIEGKNTVQMPVYSVDAEEADKNWMDILNDILKQCSGFLKKKFMYIVEQYKTGEKKDEKRRNR